jgi:integrase
MSISKIGGNKYQVRVRRVIGGKVCNRSAIVTGLEIDAKEVEVRLIRELIEAEKTRNSSLKIETFSQALKYYQQHTDASMNRDKPYFDRLNRDLGAVKISRLQDRFSDYWQLLKTERGQRTGNILKPGTRNKILILSKVVLNFCVKRGLIERNPLVCFQKVTEESRDRVLTEDEQRRILSVMRRRNSYLYWAFLFSLKNPIRRGDLFSLQRENLDRFKPWIHFKASKTRKRKNRETCLPFLDETLLEYFDTLPGDCPFLFPRIDDRGNWHQLRDPKKHWGKILTEAGIVDFHWHDLKHCAITWMLDNGYTERDIKNLGIQYTPSMIDRYYHHDAEKVLFKWRNKGEKMEGVALSNGTYDREPAILKGVL